MIDLANYPTNVALGLHWVQRALARSDLAANDRVFIEYCDNHLANLPGVSWEPTDEEWDRLMMLAGA